MSIPHLLQVGSQKPCSMFLYLKKVAMKAIKKKLNVITLKRIILTAAVTLFFLHMLPANEWQHCQPHSTLFFPRPSIHILSPCQNIRGRISLRSSSGQSWKTGWPGRGSTFVISLTPSLAQEKRIKKERRQICIKLQSAIGLWWCLQPSPQVRAPSCSLSRAQKIFLARTSYSSLTP